MGSTAPNRPALDPTGGDAPPWAGGMGSTAPNRPALDPTGGGGFASTSLDRPALDMDAAPAPSTGWGAAAPPAPPSTSAAAVKPPAGARPAKPLPKSDLGLKLALGGVVALIVLVVVGIVIGLVFQLGEPPAEGEATEAAAEE